MRRFILTALFTAALPALSSAGECRTWLTDDGWMKACVNDSLVASGATYEFIEPDQIGGTETGGPGILYEHPTLYLVYIPAYPITDPPPTDDPE